MVFLKVIHKSDAKILPAYYFPNMILFKIFNEINLSFGVILVACDLILLRKMILSCQLPLIIFENKKDLIRFARKATVLKSIKIKSLFFGRGVELAKMLGGPQCHNEEVTGFKMPQTRAFYLY